MIIDSGLDSSTGRERNSLLPKRMAQMGMGRREGEERVLPKANIQPTCVHVQYNYNAVLRYLIVYDPYQ